MPKVNVVLVGSKDVVCYTGRPQHHAVENPLILDTAILIRLGVALHPICA